MAAFATGAAVAPAARLACPNGGARCRIEAGTAYQPRAPLPSAAGAVAAAAVGCLTGSLAGTDRRIARGRRRRSRHTASRAAAVTGTLLAAPSRQLHFAARCARGGAEVAADPSSLVLCFDFDGVIGDSVDESSEAAWRHAKERWPELDLGSSAEPFLAPMRKVRPVVETGWENTVLIRILAESGTEDSLINSILPSWEEMRNMRVQEWGLDPREMIREYGEVRDRWIAADQVGWLGRNRAYDGVTDVMQAMMRGGAEVFVITTKQKRFCAALLKDFGLHFPEEKLFALEDGPKTEVLLGLLQRPALKGRTFHFIEDKLGTLKKVSALPDLSEIKLHLVDWGYNTESDRSSVRSGSLGDISLITKADFQLLGLGRSWLDLKVV